MRYPLLDLHLDRRSVQAQTRTPPLNEDESFLTPLSSSGWRATDCAMISSRAGDLSGLDEPALLHPIEFPATNGRGRRCGS
jgi:hypothetical protein